MKNIFLVTTPEKSQLYKINDKLLFEEYPVSTVYSGNLYVYITDNKKTEDGDWFFCDSPDRKGIYKCLSTLNDSIRVQDEDYLFYQKSSQKIIVTNDPKLTKEGVEKVEKKFIKWLVKNPNSEFIETYSLGVSNGIDSCHYKYEIIYPKEESKTTGNIIVDYAICRSNAIQNSMLLDAKIACDLLPQQETFEVATKSKYTKYVDEDGNYFYDVILPTGEILSKIPQSVGDYIHKLEFHKERSYSEEEVLELLQDFANDLSDNVINIKFWFEQFKKK